MISLQGVTQAEEDARFMAAAIALARRGLGVCAPNPAVGALLVRDGAILAHGVTQPGGRPHAEVEALRRAAARGASVEGATLYVTLEPCSHHGRTPPCAEAIATSGIARVVSALEDPDPRVAGRGHALLRAAGVAVTTGVGAAEALRANLGHVLRVTRGRPMIAAKLALTADGFVAAPPHEPRLAVTGEAANRYVHMLRALHDAVLIGAGTARADDPVLTVRLPGLEARRPLRIVLDGALTLSPRSRLAQTAGDHQTLVIAAERAPEANEAALRRTKIEVLRAPAGADGMIDLAAALRLVAAQGITRILSEAGPRLAEALFAADLVDEIVLLTSRRRLGRPGLCGLSAERIKALADPARYRTIETRPLGEDSLARSERIFSACSPALSATSDTSSASRIAAP